MRLRCKAELYDAEQRCREMLRLPALPPPVAPQVPVHRKAVHKRGRRLKGRCGACGCNADTYTLRCVPCTERHRQRRKHGKPYAEGALLPIHPCPLGAYGVGSAAAA